jgi:alanine-glyoxylate transaminase/serine-glyoxylate transaminase/serine-pyruvate transaminase
MDVKNLSDLDLPPRILLGPGPSMVPSRVLQAMATPPVGYMDPSYLKVMDEVKTLLRYTFQTQNKFTLPLSGTGSSGMEASLCNFIEPGDNVLIGVKGYFGERLADIALRYGALVDTIKKPWGEIFNPGEIKSALSKKRYKLVAIVHGETSTGVVQTGIEEIAAAAHHNGALLILDTVASLGGIPVDVDGWDVDICYSGSQKCLSAPPGLAPITVSPRAWEVLNNRRTAVANWYLDFKGIWRYWGDSPAYHHTGPANMIFALREALRLVAEEGLDIQLQRHRKNAELLWQGLEQLGVPPRVPLSYRMASLTTSTLPQGLDEVNVRKHLLNEFNIEVAGGFGPLAGKIWRIGLMGFSSRKENVTLLLAALKQLLSL